MSEENVEIVRQAMEAIERGDRTTYLALHDDDFEVVTTRDWPEDRVRGRDAAWDFCVEVSGAFEWLPITDVEFSDAGSEKVLVHARYHLRGSKSGASDTALPAAQEDQFVRPSVRRGAQRIGASDSI